MTNEDFEQRLALRYPKIMEKSEHLSLEINSGWHNIIEGLMDYIYEPYRNAVYRLDGASKYPRKDDGKWLMECEQNLIEQENDLPNLIQIKEKFGTLRFYYSGTMSDAALSRLENGIRLAEILSGRTCEKCSRPGYSTQSSWVKTLCKEHQAAESNIDEN